VLASAAQRGWRVQQQDGVRARHYTELLHSGFEATPCSRGNNKRRAWATRPPISRRHGSVCAGEQLVDKYLCSCDVDSRLRCCNKLSWPNRAPNGILNPLERRMQRSRLLGHTVA
jgi:hypothetical protein